MANVSPSQPDQAKLAQRLFVKAAASDRADSGEGTRLNLNYYRLVVSDSADSLA